jgi:uncharacterized protein YbcC (UPF0753/DUF2309 family)
MRDAQHPGSEDRHARLRRLIVHFEHVLPGQAAIRDFVHHNTLHGFQHLPFPEAIVQARRLTGTRGYLPAEQFRDYYRTGRITRADLEQVIDADAALQSGQVLFTTASGTPVPRRAVQLATLLHPIGAVTGCQLNWQIEEGAALSTIQPDVDAAGREHLLQAAQSQGQTDEPAAICDLWSACLLALGLEHYLLHPEELLDLPPEKAEALLSQVIREEEDSGTGRLLMDRLVDREATMLLDELFDPGRARLTLAGLLHMVSGEDLMEAMRPLLIRHIGAFLDQGIAAWTSPDRDQGFYRVWRESAMQDLAWMFDDLPDWQDNIDALPDDPLDTIVIELLWLGLPEEEWESYLERLALELPGWSGMFLWRHNHPGYAGLDHVRVDMADYLAVRLVLEHLFAQRLCRRLWKIEASFDVIRWYFRHNHAEFLVRYTVYNRHLPEYLITLAQHLLTSSSLCGIDSGQWLHLAHMIITWRQSIALGGPGGFTVHDHGWRLFRLAQHLGLCGADLSGLERATLHRVFACLDQFDPERSGYLWLQAYENHYRDQLFNALVNNQGRGNWETRSSRPKSQVVFCMDDREEGFRRHLEEQNPQIETLGAAGFFGVPIYWRGLDDSGVTPLCPVVVTPSHEIREQADRGQAAQATRHNQRRRWRLALKELLYQETRRNLLASGLVILLAAPATLAVLVAKVLAPRQTGRLTEKLRRVVDLEIPTRLTLTSQDDKPATPEHPRLGFTDAEQADRVYGLLRTIGLQSGFAQLVVMMGHGSGSQNNPHLAAYDCGACSGRHGGPNARVFAAMANRPEIRTALKQRGCEIPPDTWFLGAEHNTCDEAITWYDTETLPPPLAPAFSQLQRDIDAAVLGSAHERSRRLASAPRNLTPQRALRHIIGRAYDFSQARPELGHATNAAALIGRRSVTQGAFFDRRVFLISYDPTRDPGGEILADILLAAGPVGAGINLEYYFSTVNNEQYGCGTKITHNVTGLFGVMEGTGSDLRTGLPKQMIEIHEAMRLQVVVEASTGVLTRIYERQPALQELIGNGWLLLASKDPKSAAIHIFKPGSGFVPWQGRFSPLPTASSSADWYRGHPEPLKPALIDTGGARE